MKIYAFDIDNTLVKLPKDHKYIWSLLNEFFGTQKEDDEFFELYCQGKLSYHQWVVEDLKMYQEKGGNKTTIYQALDHCKLFPGVRNVLDELNKKGEIVCTISGSIDTLLEKFKIKDRFHISLVNKIPFKNKEIDLDNIKTTEYDLEKKKEGIIKICSIFNTSLNDCFYVGDSDSDSEICRFIKENEGISLAINTDSEKLKKACTKQIYDIEDILRLK